MNEQVTNVLSLTTRSRPSQSSELATKLDALTALLGRSSARVLLCACAILAVARAARGDYALGDGAVVASTVVLVGTAEWIIHKYLLHAGADAWTTRVLGTSVGHGNHHRSPTDLDWLLLRGVDAGVFVVAFGAVTAAWSLPLLRLLDQPLLGGFLTAWLCAAVALFHYEWVHLLVHTRYRPRTRYYKRLARNHRLHHYRNENHWFGVTSNTGDRWLRTYPKQASDVPLSETARTLGAT